MARRSLDEIRAEAMANVDQRYDHPGWRPLEYDAEELRLKAAERIECPDCEGSGEEDDPYAQGSTACERCDGMGDLAAWPDPTPEGRTR